MDRNIAASYFLGMAKWIVRLRRAQGAWSQAWVGGNPPQLCFERPGGRTVLDTRSGSVVVHDVGEDGRRVLEALAQPTTHEELAKAARTFDPPLDLEAELARLRALGLLFEDGQRLIRLVLPRPARPVRVLRRFTFLEAAPAA